MAEVKELDVFNLGQNTFNFHYNNLKLAKKNYKNYITIIDEFISSISDHKKSLDKINQEINKYSQIDQPFCFLKKFEFLLNSHSDYIGLFLENITNLLSHLKTSINTVSNNIGNYLSKSQKLAMDVKNESENYFQNYNKLMKSLEETEMAIIDDYTKEKYRICIKKSNKNKEVAIDESKKYEEDFLNLIPKMKEKAIQYINEYNTNLKNLKPQMIELNEKCKEDLLNIIKLLRKNYNNFITLLFNESKNIKNYDNNDKSKKDFEEYLNYEIKQDDSCEILQAIKPVKYNVKIIKEEEKNLIETDNFKSVPKNKKLTKNLNYTGQDIYNIVEIIYNLKFKLVDEDTFKLDKEKVKIEIVNYMQKLLGYNFSTHEFGNEGFIIEEEIKKLINLIFLDKEYLNKFLFCLNFYRTTGKYELKLNVFRTIKEIFDKIADNLLINNDKRIPGFLMILSQTFYVTKEGKKYFLQKELCKKEFFRSTAFWSEHLDDMIKEELNKFEEESKRNKIVFSEQNKKKKINEILFSKLASLVASINGFELEKEKVDEILLPLMDKYNISEDTKQAIFSMIQAK